MNIPTDGQFVWYDLMTPDPDGSAKFYAELFGWSVRDTDMGGVGSYRMIHLGESGIGGMVALDPSHGVPPHWIAYVTCDDVDAAVEKAMSLGGGAPAEGTDIPEVGRFAVIHGPDGAPCSPFAFSGEWPPEPEGPPPFGGFCWNELLTHDPDAAYEFYAQIFGWGRTDLDMGPMGAYIMLHRGETQAGAGIMKMPPDAESPPHWLSYVHVDSVDATAAQIETLGGKVWVPPSDIPGIGRFSVAEDPIGAKIAVFGRSPDPE